MLNNSLYDSFTGRCIRRIVYDNAPANAIYLTFDDGPNDFCTPQVLDLLKKYQVFATFFLIGNKAKEHLKITRRIQTEGHHIGNHSIDHDTRRYFSNITGTSKWITESEDIFEKELRITPVGFRSPVGMKTPPLNKMLTAKKIPLVLWDVRFFDSIYGLSKNAVNKKLSSISSGSIVLLHDNHKGVKKTNFLIALEYLIIECKKKNLHFLPLEKTMIEKSFVEKYGLFK